MLISSFLTKARKSRQRINQADIILCLQKFINKWSKGKANLDYRCFQRGRNRGIQREKNKEINKAENKKQPEIGKKIICSYLTERETKNLLWKIKSILQINNVKNK